MRTGQSRDQNLSFLSAPVSLINSYNSGPRHLRWRMPCECADYLLSVDAAGHCNSQRGNRRQNELIASHLIVHGETG